ncbi:hypothetical protein ACP4OV_004830 [Aristida adscensionis]
MVPAAAAPQGVRRGAGAAITEEERRRNRMTSNRLSARKSRMKQRQYVEDLAALADGLRRENEAMRAGVDGALRRSRLLEQENRVLAAHARELCAALLLRNSQLRVLGEVAGVPLDVPGVPDHLARLYGGGTQTQTPQPLLFPPSSLPMMQQLPLEIQMLLQNDAMDAAGILDGF